MEVNDIVGQAQCPAQLHEAFGGDDEISGAVGSVTDRSVAGVVVHGVGRAAGLDCGLGRRRHPGSATKSVVFMDRHLHTLEDGWPLPSQCQGSKKPTARIGARTGSPGGRLSGDCVIPQPRPRLLPVGGLNRYSDGHLLGAQP